jgi:hypothetical protein
MPSAVDHIDGRPRRCTDKRLPKSSSAVSQSPFQVERIVAGWTRVRLFHRLREPSCSEQPVAIAVRLVLTLAFSIVLAAQAPAEPRWRAVRPSFRTVKPSFLTPSVTTVRELDRVIQLAEFRDS